MVWLFIAAACCWLVAFAQTTQDLTAIHDLEVLLFSAPKLQVNVSFTHMGQTHEFNNMQRSNPIARSAVHSTTFRYLGKKTRAKWATLTLLPQDRITGLFSFQHDDKVQYTVEINTNYISKDRILLAVDNNDEDRPVAGTKMQHCGTQDDISLHRPPPDPEGKDPLPILSVDEDDYNEAHEQRRNLQVLEWTGKNNECFNRDDLPRSMRIGIAYDQAFALRSKAEGYTSPEKLIEVAVAKASAVYAAQMNIHIEVDAVYSFADAAQSSSGAVLTMPNRAQCSSVYDPMSLELVEMDCCNDGRSMSSRLEMLRTWSNTLPLRSSNAATTGNAKRLAHWHLFTDCHPAPGFLGSSYIGTLCHATHGVGLTSFGPESTPNVALWRIFAHELGHAFNASHSFEMGVGRTGGLMDYGDGKYLGDYQFHYLKHDDVCSELATQVDTCEYFHLLETRCGDGYVDHNAGEECDCGMEPSSDCLQDCDVTLCKLLPGSQCVRNTQCCNERGTFPLAHEVVCTTAQNHAGVCIAGTCQAAGICPAAVSMVCEATSSCQVACGPNCNARVPLPDGIPCENSGKCKSGVCVLPQLSATLPNTATCVDLAKIWWDNGGPTFTCEWYAKRPAMCAQYGFTGRNFGYTAMQACCACGGGKDPNALPTTRPTNAPSAEEKPAFTANPTFRTPAPSAFPSKKPTSAFPSKAPTPTKICPTEEEVLRCHTKKSNAACNKTAQCKFCKVTSKPVLQKYRKKKLCVPTSAKCNEALMCGLL